MITSFKIFERMGIAESSLVINDFLTDYVFEVFEENFKDLTLKDNFQYKKIIDYRAFKGQVKILDEFPLRKVDLTINIKRLNNDWILGGSNKNYDIGASAYPFDKNLTKKDDIDDLLSDIENDDTGYSLMLPKGTFKNEGIQFKIDIEFSLKPNFKLSHFFKLELKATISHELNHIYEMYQRLDTEDARFSETFGSMVNYNIPTYIWQDFKKFCSLIYMSDSSEVNARIQESLVFIRAGYKITKLPFYRPMISMIKFDPKRWSYKIRKTIKEETTNDQMTSRKLMRAFKKYYMNNLSKQSEKSLFDLKKMDKCIESTDLEGFFRLFEPFIKKAGEKLKKGVLRLHSYNDGNDS